MPSKVSSFLRYFYVIDIFGLKTEFQIDQKPKFKTMSGAFFTLVYVGFIILLFFSFGGDMINRTGPETSVSQIFQASPSPTIVSRDNYMFVFGLQDSTATHFIDEEIYSATLTYSSRDPKTRQDSVKIIPIERCEEANLPKEPKLVEYFKNQANNLSDLYCIAKNYTEPLVLQGAWDQSQYNFFRLYISPCNSSQRTCKSEAAINDMLKSGYYAYYNTDYLFDLRNYETPANIIGRDYFTGTTTKIKKIINHYLRTNHLYDDHGWITDSPRETDNFSFDNDQTSFELLTQTDNIVDMVVRKLAYETILTRKYKKIQNVFAEMTGFLQIIFVALYIISGPFIKKEYYESLTNSIYNFEIDADPLIKKKEISKKGGDKILDQKEKLQNLKTIMMGTEKENDSQEIVSEKLSQAHIKKKKKNDEELVNCLFKLKQSPLNLSYREMMKGIFVKEPDLEIKKAQRNTGVSSIFSQLDIKFVLKKFAEIDKLKMLLLNEDQYHLFEYLPKPVITKNAKINLNYIEKQDCKTPIRQSMTERKSSFFVHQNDLVLKAKTVQKAFENIINKPEMNETDKKLIQSLDMDILKVLEANANVDDSPKNKTSKFRVFEQTHEKLAIEMDSLGDVGRESVFSEKKEEIVTDRNAELMNTFKSTDSKK